MSYEIKGFTLGTLRAPTTFWGNRQYYGVNASSSEGFIKIAVGNASSSGSPIGILQNAPSVADEAAEIMVMGVSKAFCLTAVSAGANFIFSTSGAIASSTAAGALTTSWGPVLESASSGEYATVLLRPVDRST